MRIPFNKPYVAANSLRYLSEALERRYVSGDGPFCQKCSAWLEEQLGCSKALLTPSGTAALEMAVILADIKPGDEVIMPSFTFPSTANAVVLRCGVPVFVDIRSDTCNLDETKIEAAITEKTKAIIPVHYAGIPCEMDKIMDIAARHNLLVIEDAAQGILSFYKGRALGSIGHFAALSFHETKNLMAGEGGALLINNPRFTERAEIVREKGTNRSKFFRGEIDKYNWVDIGSSFLPNELTAAFLFAQMEEADEIIERRLKIWEIYHSAFASLEENQELRRPIIPKDCRINGHITYIISRSLNERTQLISHLKKQRIAAIFHYMPLHSSPMGKKYCYAHGNLTNTDQISDRLLRLPMYCEMEIEEVDRVVVAVKTFYKQRKVV